MAELVDIVHLPPDRDVAMQKLHVDEYWEKTYPKIILYRLDREATAEHPLYHEAMDKVYSEEAILLRAYVDPEPTEKLLKKHGMADKRAILVTVTTLDLDRNNLLTQSSTNLHGDLFVFDGEQFEIRKQSRDKSGYWANTNIPLLMNFICTLHRKGS